MRSFRRWWGRPQTPALGVDIGVGGVRVIELARRGRDVQIMHYGYQTLPAGAIRDGSIVLYDEVCVALQEALRCSGSRVQAAALALPASAVIKKIVSLPAQSNEDELEIQVEAEAMALLPVAREEIAVDFAVLGPSTQQPNAVDVMLVAARQEKIVERTELARSVGLKPAIIDIESQALLAAMHMMLSPSEIAPELLLGVLHIDTEQAYAYFIQGESLLFERQLGSTVARKEATATETICQEFSRAFQLSQTAGGINSLHHIYLLGAVPADLKNALAQRLSIGVSILNPWQAFSVSTALAVGDEEHPSACILACGLASRRFDP